jgi:hypothetical protein
MHVRQTQAVMRECEKRKRKTTKQAEEAALTWATRKGLTGAAPMRATATYLEETRDLGVAFCTLIRVVRLLLLLLLTLPLALVAAFLLHRRRVPALLLAAVAAAVAAAGPSVVLERDGRCLVAEGFELGRLFARHFDDLWREVGQLAHVDAKASVARTVLHRVQHLDLACMRAGGMHAHATTTGSGTR